MSSRDNGPTVEEFRDALRILRRPPEAVSFVVCHEMRKRLSEIAAEYQPPFAGAFPWALVLGIEVHVSDDVPDGCVRFLYENGTHMDVPVE